ncbi:FixH family protein [Aurantibacillus circumpalustris]|uniref:FixH family protein n=1 Tax=Aurantibacillus circumpalustris TaxID=3036359 RepID=UPI00295B047A|nr:FixH family protein [Aurantibacillus circumpalustris]
MKLSYKIIALSAATVLTFSCKKKETKIETPTPIETPVETTTMNKLGEVYIQGANAKAFIYTTSTLQTGYNEIYVALFDSTDGSSLSTGHFDILPIMDMGTMQHSSPVENTEDTVVTNGYFKTAVIFSMAGTASQWFLNLNFHNHKNQKFGAAKFGVNVAASSPSKFKSTVVAADNNASIFITLLNPLKPEVGINDFEIVLHKKNSMMEFLPIDDYTVEIEPTMPSMGHGSPNNVNPVITEKGHYKGKVNFTMSGLWQIKIKLSKNGTALSDTQYFEITI